MIFGPNILHLIIYPINISVDQRANFFFAFESRGASILFCAVDVALDRYGHFHSFGQHINTNLRASVFIIFAKFETEDVYLRH